MPQQLHQPQEHIPNQAEKDFIEKLKNTPTDNSSNAYNDVKELFERLFLQNQNEAGYFKQITDTAIFSLLSATNYTFENKEQLVKKAVENLFGENEYISGEEGEKILQLSKILREKQLLKLETVFSKFIQILELAIIATSIETPNITTTGTPTAITGTLSLSSFSQPPSPSSSRS